MPAIYMFSKQWFCTVLLKQCDMVSPGPSFYANKQVCCSRFKDVKAHSQSAFIHYLPPPNYHILR